MSTKAASTTNALGAPGFDAIYPGAAQKVTTSASSAQSAAVGHNTTVVRLYCDQDCYIAIGPSPTAAAATGTILPAGQAEYFAINPNEKIAAIQVSTAGTLFITEGA